MLCSAESAASAAMAGNETSADMAMCTDSEVTKLRGTKIFVSVEEALIDVLIVSYHCDSKVFQGALLDVSKKNSPYGIPFIRPWDTTPDLSSPAAPMDDRFTSLRQRHTYNQQDCPSDRQTTGIRTRKPVTRTIRDQNVRMRRLRPRQVLCSHCRAICNENSENVQLENTRKTNNNKDSWMHSTFHDTTKTTQDDQHRQSKTLTPVQTNSVVPEVQTSRTIDNAVVPKVESEQNLRCNSTVYGLIRSEEDTSNINNEYQAVSQNQLSNRMILRKRKSEDMGHNCSGCVVHPKHRRLETVLSQERYGPMEGSDATVGTTQTKNSATKTSPVIKISFSNPEGRDTVLKIPARLQSASDTEEGGTTPTWTSGDDRTINGASAATKAARKALKKAKKDAQKKCTAEQQHKSSRHHHKHKTKRKRKHRELIDDELPQLLSPNPDSYYEEVKNKCLKQKLSISLKRLNAKAYMRCTEKRKDDVEDDGGGGTGSSESEYGEVPDFPVHELVKPLMMRITSHNVKKCVLENGREMAVGDIVWGKIHGFPWWPGKVLALTVSQRDNGVTINRQAHVAWFGSSTSSYMPCSQLSPFLNDFKTRYNKKKRGPYKEAIRQATLEARQIDQLLNVTADLSIVNRPDRPSAMC